MGARFCKLVDLGTITVPQDYNCNTRLSVFRNSHCNYNDDFVNQDPLIIDENFPNPSRILKPGEILAVTVFRRHDYGVRSVEVSRRATGSLPRSARCKLGH